MSFDNVPLAFEDHGTTTREAEMTKLHEQAKLVKRSHSTGHGSWGQYD